jgi:hypothetical protein
VPPEYEQEPLRGNQSLLARAICPDGGVEIRPRGLKALALEGVIWVVKPNRHKHLVEVYFKDKRLRAEANGKLQNLRKEQNQARNERNRTKKAEK